MANFFHYYRQFIYLEKPTTINELKVGGFYRLYIYKYEETGVVETYKEAKTPILLIIGKNTSKKLIYALKINELPLRRFIKIYDDVQNQEYTRQMIKEIEDNDKKTSLQKLDYTTGAKAILIDKTGKSFYNKTVKQNRDLKKYDVYRSYKKGNVRSIKELYLDLSKLKSRLGFKDYNEEGPELDDNKI
jgi:hypothetical protein